MLVAHALGASMHARAEVIAVGERYAAVRGWGQMDLESWELLDSGYGVYPSREELSAAIRENRAWRTLCALTAPMERPKHLSAEQIEQMVKLIKGER